jgi:4-amino-4-deoxy-L-arabinose transferase-like glycosyltransferase
MLELSIGHNGVERFVRRNRPAAGTVVLSGAGPSQSPAAANSGGGARGRGTLINRVPAGPLRLADRELAGQVGWLLPLAVMGFIFGASWTSFRAGPTSAQRELLLWAGWAVCYGAVYSSAGGIFHAYYLATMAPALAALAGVGVVGLWRRFVEGRWAVLLLPGTLAITSEWQGYIQSVVPGWSTLSFALSNGSRVAVLVLLITGLAAVASQAARRVALGAVVAALAILLLTPGAWALSSVLVRGAVMPSANLSRLAQDDGGADAGGFGTAWQRGSLHRLLRFLQANHHDERFLIATSSTQVAAPIIIETGHAAMAMGGFMGADPILTPERLAQLVETGQVRFVMLGDDWRMWRRVGLEGGGQAVSDWVRANGRRVAQDLWREPGEPSAANTAPRRGFGRGLTSRELYDLRPLTGVAGHEAG